LSCCEAIFLILELDTVNVLYGKARCAIRLILSYIFSVDILKVEDVFRKSHLWRAMLTRLAPVVE